LVQKWRRHNNSETLGAVAQVRQRPHRSGNPDPPVATMSGLVEWMGPAAAVTIASAGTEIGEDTVDELAVVFSVDTVCVIEGTRPPLRRLLAEALARLDEAGPRPGPQLVAHPTRATAHVAAVGASAARWSRTVCSPAAVASAA